MFLSLILILQDKVVCEVPQEPCNKVKKGSVLRKVGNGGHIYQNLCPPFLYVPTLHLTPN